MPLSVLWVFGLGSIAGFDAAGRGIMMAGLLKIGDKIELGKVTGSKNAELDDLDTYVSQILDFRDDMIIAAMPISEGHIVPLEINTRMEAFFYTAQGIYRSRCTITERGKEGNLFVCGLLLNGELKKFQRRQYYRLPCTIGTDIILMDIMEIINYSNTHEMSEKPVNDVHSGMIVDISGGGVRVMSDMHFNKNDYVMLRFPVEMNIGTRQVEIMGKIVLSLESPNKNNYYDNRIQFKEVSRELRDIIVKYIFEQQRKIQKRERG